MINHQRKFLLELQTKDFVGLIATSAKLPNNRSGRQRFRNSGCHTHPGVNIEQRKFICIPKNLVVGACQVQECMLAKRFYEEWPKILGRTRHQNNQCHVVLKCRLKFSYRSNILINEFKNRSINNQSTDLTSGSTSLPRFQLPQSRNSCCCCCCCVKWEEAAVENGRSRGTDSLFMFFFASISSHFVRSQLSMLQLFFLLFCNC